MASRKPKAPDCSLCRYIKPKRKGVWTCRVCGARACEHHCGGKLNDRTAVCNTCKYRRANPSREAPRVLASLQQAVARVLHEAGSWSPAVRFHASTGLSGPRLEAAHVPRLDTKTVAALKRLARGHGFKLVRAKDGELDFFSRGLSRGPTHVDRVEVYVDRTEGAHYAGFERRMRDGRRESFSTIWFAPDAEGHMMLSFSRRVSPGNDLSAHGYFDSKRKRVVWEALMETRAANASFTRRGAASQANAFVRHHAREARLLLGLILRGAPGGAYAVDVTPAGEYVLPGAREKRVANPAAGWDVSTDKTPIDHAKLDAAFNKELDARVAEVRAQAVEVARAGLPRAKAIERLEELRRQLRALESMRPRRRSNPRRRPRGR